ncbi:GrpB family protein [bacterium]|nr:GrpB family protein [bacterium]MBT3581855.1 GrpB family protein [bacterium]MBT4552848.1 GrpB family protein [bacterium]
MALKRKIEVLAYTPEWAKMFEAEKKSLEKLFGNQVVQIHHIGSTAIPGLAAKPIIDVLVEVQNIETIDKFNEEMKKQVYLPQGDFGISGRRFFIKGTKIHRTHHIHIFQTGNPEIQKHLNFRDYMRQNPEEVVRYAKLKQNLARRFPHDIEKYMAGKNDFISQKVF